jgi:hypothetical protein
MTPQRAIHIDVTSVGAGVQTITLGTNAAVGTAISFRVRLMGVQNNGERGLYFAPEGTGARNAIGNGLGTPILIGTTGYTDAAAVPWTTIGVPAGWAATLAFVVNVLTLSFNGAAGQTVIWRGMMEVWYHNGATV